MKDNLCKAVTNRTICGLHKDYHRTGVVYPNLGHEFVSGEEPKSCPPAKVDIERLVDKLLIEAIRYGLSPGSIGSARGSFRTTLEQAGIS